MKQRVKGLFSVILALTLVFGAFQPVVAFAEEQETITVFGKDSTLVEETPFAYQENLTAFDALVNTVGADNVQFSTSEYGKMITSIKGLAAEGTFYWAFYINGVSAQVGADSYKVQDGDEISFHYVDWTVASQNPVSLKVEGDKEKGIIIDNNYLSLINEPTALDLLQVGLGNKKVETSDTQYGKMITSIDGLAAEGTYYWAFYVNGKMASVGADSYKLQSGDVVNFKYESWETPAEDGETNNPANGEVKPVTTDELKKSVDSVTNYILANNVGEWEVVSLKQAGKTIPASYLENVKNVIKEKQGKFARVTDTERYTLGILAAGGNPLNIEGYNLIEKIYNGDLTKQGLNGVTYGLIALDSANFEVPQSAKWTRESLLKHLLEKQNTDGGWSWDGSSTSDLDTTGMVLTALAPYKNQSDVKPLIDKAVNYLSEQYKAEKVNNSSTAAQLVIALSALGIDSASPQFTKDVATSNSVTALSSNVENLISYLLSFQNSDGGFDWQGGETSDSFSTSLGVQGLVSYQLFLEGKGSLFNLPIVEKIPDSSKDTAVKQPNPNQGNGKLLPNTATNTSNILLMGLFLLCIGIAKLAMDRRKKA